MRASQATTTSASQSRREFIRKVGGAVFTLTLVDICDPRVAHGAIVCSSGTRDFTCGHLYSKDENCHIHQVPSTSKDHDDHCDLPLNNEADGSCGDCDDWHDTDSHCGKQLPSGATDTDELCGHQHNSGLDEDDRCSAEVKDVGCGTHETGYGGQDTDEDAHCHPDPDPEKAVPDMDCTGSETGDSYCNEKTNSSTTSPDERCSSTDYDEACSHYDADESCGLSKPPLGEDDQSCGIYPNPLGEDFRDADNYCPTPIDENDQSEKENKGPINPWCPLQTDPDYWDPA